MTTATVITVMHDAHVACRTSFVAARTAMVRKATARRVAAATRSATYVANRTATKAANAAKKAAAVVAKLLKAANAARLAAVRVQRMAAKASKTITTAVVAIDKAYALSVTPCTPVVAPATVNVYSIVAFLAMTPCLVALWFMATFDIAVHASDKEDAKATAKAANKVHARIRAPRVRINDEAKRASITLACANARASKAAQRAADAHAIALVGSVMSQRTIAARAAQGAAQREANEARKAGMTTKVARTHVVVVRSTPTKVRGAKRVRVHHMAHTVESVAKLAADRAHMAAVEAAHKAFLAKIKEDKAIMRAKKAAQRKVWIQLRKEKVARICAKAWMDKGVWVDTFLAEACNDACYEIRTSAMTELLALVGVAA